jgi:hypothetical protein
MFSAPTERFELASCLVKLHPQYIALARQFSAFG